MLEETNDIWTCTGANMFDFGNDSDAIGFEDEDEDIVDEDFLNKTRMIAITDFDNVIKLWKR